MTSNSHGGDLPVAAGLLSAAARETLREFISRMPNAIAVFDREMRYVAASPTWLLQARLPLEQLLGRSQYELFPQIPQRWRDQHRRGFAGEESVGRDDPIVGPDGRSDWIDWTIKPWRESDGSVTGIIINSELTTGRHLATVALRDSEARRHAIFETMAEGLVVQRQDGRILDANQAACDLLGMSMEQLLGRTSLDPHWRAIREDGSDFPGEEHPAMVTLRTRQAVRDQVMGVRLGSDEPRWLSINTRILPEQMGGYAGAVIVTFVDITAQRTSISKLRELTNRLGVARQEERVSVATMLHEGVAQDLFAVKMGIEHLRAQSSGRLGVTQMCDELARGVQRAMQDLRDVSNALHPDALVHLGFMAALDQVVRPVAQRANLELAIDAEKSPTDISRDHSLAMFRVAQEAVRNVIQHASAARVEVTLSATDQELLLTVADDGCGMPAGAQEKPGSFGLFSMIERLGNSGGSLRIEANRPRGTRLIASLPVTLPG